MTCGQLLLGVEGEGEGLVIDRLVRIGQADIDQAVGAARLLLGRTRLRRGRRAIRAESPGNEA